MVSDLLSSSWLLYYFTCIEKAGLNLYVCSNALLPHAFISIQITIGLLMKHPLNLSQMLSVLLIFLD